MAPLRGWVSHVLLALPFSGLCDPPQQQFSGTARAETLLVTFVTEVSLRSAACGSSTTVSSRVDAQAKILVARGAVARDRFQGSRDRGGGASTGLLRTPGMKRI